MAVKSNFKLDDRIKSIDDIQTILCNNNDFVGCDGYFFDEFIQTKDLSKCRYGELIDITTHDDRNDLCFKAEYEEGLVGFYRFFIPESDLKPIEKTYRPYTLAEWIDKHGIGDVVHYRSKSEGIELHHMYVGYACGIGKNINEIGVGTLTLGVASYSFDYLFEDYELFYNGRWFPFGVLDNGEEE